MFNCDKPLENANQDKLNRRDFASHLAKAIFEYNTCQDGLVIGLCGPWGSGKTSLLNMLVSELNKENTKDKIIIVRFNPWIFSNREQLIKLYFDALTIELRKSTDNFDKKKIVAAMEKYSDLIGLIEYVPYGQILGKILKVVTNCLKNYINEDIFSLKQKINKQINDLNLRFLVIIDDIDRLTASEVLSIFQLVKAVADFSNTIYLLAFDRNMVSRVLNKAQIENGDEYMQKIIQVQFEIPAASSSDIENIFYERLLKIIPKEDSNKINDDHWYLIYQYCIRPFTKSVRDINRILSTFSLKYNIVRSEICIPDLLALSVLEIFHPVVYDKIKHYKDEVCGGASEKENYNKVTNGKVLESLTYSISEDKKEPLINFLKALFPKVSHIGTSIGLNEQNFDDIASRRDNWICNNNCFDTYFLLHLQSGALPSVEVKKIAFEYSSEEIEYALRNIAKQHQERDFFDIFSTLSWKQLNAQNINSRLIILIKALSEWMILNGEDFEVGRLSVNSIKAMTIINLVEKLSNEESRYEILKLIFSNLKASFGLVASLYNYSASEHQLSLVKEGKTESIINNAHAIDLRKVVLDRIKEQSNDLSLLDEEGIEMNFSLWQELDGNSYNQFISEAKNSNIILAKLLGKYIHRGIKASVEERDLRIKFVFDAINFSKHFSLDESYDQMLKFIAGEEVNKLTIWQLENLFAFMVYFENERENVLEDITLNNVKKRIEQMRSHDNQLGLKEKNSRKGNF